MKRCVAFALVCLLWLPLSGCASWDAWQRQHVYRPTPIEPAQWQAFLHQNPDLSASELPLPGGGHTEVLHVPAVPGRISPVRVLYLHGTLRNVIGNLEKIRGITRNGLDVDAIDYRGWGVASPLLPDETSLHDDALQSWLALQAAAPAGLHWVVYGHSMGTALAVQLAQTLGQEPADKVCALVLESAFTRFSDVARAASGVLGPVAAALTTQTMDSLSRIGQVRGPVWMMHGRNDHTVPMALGKRLFDAAPEPKYWLELPKDHSDLQTDESGRYDQVWQQVRTHCVGSGP